MTAFLAGLTPWTDLFLVTLTQALAWLTAIAGFGLVAAFAVSRLRLGFRRGGRRGK
jgi:hypothetical protein